MLQKQYKKRTYALKSYAITKRRSLKINYRVCCWKLKEMKVKLIGNFNAYNVRHLQARPSNWVR
jgi:hypothetical protein